MDGNISFVVGTQIDGVITRDAEEVPVANILDHVSPAEIERFENHDFFAEDERERLLPPRKPRGRPRKGESIVPSFNIAPIGQETSREQSLLPEGSISIKKKLGRPKGSHNRGPHKKKAYKLTLKPFVLSETSTATKKGRGRPPLQKNLSVVIPSFDGPQPQELESTPGAESESDDMLGDPKPQYSMVAASGLGQSDTEDVTSRDQSIDLVAPSKKRRLDTSNAFIDLSSDANGGEGSPQPTKRAKTLPETSPDPIADDRAALLRQFQARVYGPDHSEKGSTIPHRQSKPSPTPDDSTALVRQFHTHIRSSSLDSSSSDSLMGPTPRPLKPLPAQSVPSEPLPGKTLLPQDNSAKVPASYLNNSITVSHSPRRQPAKATPAKSLSPAKSIPRRVSLTPHFPPSTSFSHIKSLGGSTASKPQPSISSASRHAPSQATNTTFSQTSRIMPSAPKKRKPSPVPGSAPSHSSQASSTSKIGFAGLQQAKDITDYFAPKATVAKETAIKALHSPASQLLDPEDSESEDQLARQSSTDSISSGVIVVRQNHVTPSSRAVTAEARPQEPSHNQARSVLDGAEDDSSDDESEDEHGGTTRVSNTAAPVPPTASPAKAQSSAGALNEAFDAEDDEDSDSDSDGSSDHDSDNNLDHNSDNNSDNNSDSLSSEVMIVRPS